jgi:phage tail-like protein
LNRKILSIALILAFVAASTAFMVAVRAPSSPPPTFIKYRFLVEIDGIVQASFMEVEGLNVTVDVVEYREGSDPLAPSLLPGNAHYGPLVLRNGLTSSNELLAWMEETADGAPTRASMSIIILSPDGIEVARYNISNAFPSSWKLGTLNSQDIGPAVEELTIQYEGFERDIG